MLEKKVCLMLEILNKELSESMEDKNGLELNK
jgi:hypothetical protein